MHWFCSFSSAGIIQKAVWNQVFTWQNPRVYWGGEEEGRRIQTTGMDWIYAFVWKAGWFLLVGCSRKNYAVVVLFEILQDVRSCTVRCLLAKCTNVLRLFSSNAGYRVRKSSSGCVSVSIHTEDSGDCQQHQKTEGGNYKGTSESKWCTQFIHEESKEIQGSSDELNWRHTGRILTT